MPSSSDTLSALFEDARSRFPSELLDSVVLPLLQRAGSQVVHLDHSRAQGTWECPDLHQQAPSFTGWGVPRGAPARPSPVPQVDLSATDVLDFGLETCSCCLTIYTLYMIPGPPRLLHDVFVLDDVLKDASRVSARSSPAAVQRALASLRERASTLSSSPRTGLPAAVDEFLDGLLAGLAAEVSRVSAHAVSDAARERVLARVRVGLVGREAAPSFVFDDSPTLLAVPSFASWQWNGVVGSLVDLFKVRDEGGVVLQVPRFVADYVAGLPKARRNGLLPSAPLLSSDSSLVVETAVRLWEPGASGPLASLSGALQAARALE